MSARELASRLSLDQSHLSKVENGKRLASVETTARILGTLQASSEECERILELARNASEPNWLAVGIPGIPAQLAGSMESEREASLIVQWAPMTIPGLLQTTGYARALAEAETLSKPEVESRVTVRIARREVLTSRKPVTLDVLIGEVALRERVGGPETMVEQLRHLIKVVENPNVTLRVVPIGAGWHPGCVGPFVLYNFSAAPPFVHFEHYSSGAFVTDADDIEAYHKAIRKIGLRGLNRAESIDFIARVIVEEWSD